MTAIVRTLELSLMRVKYTDSDGRACTEKQNVTVQESKESCVESYGNDSLCVSMEHGSEDAEFKICAESSSLGRLIVILFCGTLSVAPLAVTTLSVTQLPSATLCVAQIAASILCAMRLAAITFSAVLFAAPVKILMCRGHRCNV